MNIRTIEDGFQWNIKQALRLQFKEYQTDLARGLTTSGFEDWIYNQEGREREAGSSLLEQAIAYTNFDTLFDED